MGTVTGGNAIVILNRNDPVYDFVQLKGHTYCRKIAEYYELNSVADERMKNRKIMKINPDGLELESDSRALKNLQRISHPVREQFKKKLSEHLKKTRLSAGWLLGCADCHKIKPK